MARSKEELISEEVTAFFSEHMSVHPESISVSFHPGSIVIVLKGAICEGEKACSKDRSICEHMERYYSDIYEQSRIVLESSVDRSLGIKPTDSFMRVHIQSASFVVVLMTND